MRINNNLMAMNTHRQLGISNNQGSKSMEKLSSGFRINRAGDDAAGLAISEKMRGQIRGLNQASRNAQDGISLIQTAEGALTETHAILQRMRELAVQAANDTNNTSDRGEVQKEINQLTSEINRIANTTEFNTNKLANTTGTGFTANFQVGANNGQSMTIEIKDMTATALGLEGTASTAVTYNATVGASVSTLGVATTAATGATFAATSGVNNGTSNTATGAALDVSNHTKAAAAVEVINNAIETVSSQRSTLGAYQNRLEHTIKNLNNSSENLQAAESRIRDVDMAKEMMEFTKTNILQQAAQAMLAQANQAPQGVLQLLR